MATSPNGWPVSPDAGAIDVEPFEVAGVTFYGGVRGGKVHDVLKYVASAVHSRVQPVNQSSGCYGWNYRANVNDPSVWSNHASATAIDFNATQNPNGVPTASVFTQAQIDEVHAILDEVDGVVRWGGDYLGVADSMHFEIDVSPLTLEGSSFEFPAASTQWPIGRAYDAVPPAVLTEMSVSYPTMLARDEEGNGVWWTYTASQSGRISIDALLSHYLNPDIEGDGPGPNVTLTVYRDSAFGPFVGSSSSFPGGFGYPPRNQGRMVLEVEAGVTYWIRAFGSSDWPYIRAVVRIGDFAEEPEWVQPPDQIRVWCFDDESHFWDEGVTKDMEMHFRSNFRGGDRGFWTGFGEPSVYDDASAIACDWRWSRRFWASGGVWYWTTDGGFESPSPGVCPVFTGFTDIDSGWGTFGPAGVSVGWTYDVDPGSFGFASNISTAVYAGAFSIRPDVWLEEETRSGVGTTTISEIPYMPTPQPNEIFEWENDFSTLIDIDYAFDQYVGTDNSTQVDMVAKWYAGEGPDPYNDTHVPGKWEPWVGNQWWGQGGDSPENYAASQEHLGDTIGGMGSWLQLPTELLVHDVIRFTVLSNHHLVADPPTSITTGNFDRADYLNNLLLAFRSTIRPSRYRIFPDPGIPDIDWAGEGAILFGLLDSGQVLY